MQLIWLSGPTARVVTLSITRKTVLLGIACFAALLLMLGALLQFLGLRVAIELRPDLARTLGAVTTTSEQQRIEQHYQEQLAALEAQIQSLTRELGTLERTKRQLVELVPVRPTRAVPGGQGGPSLPLLNEFQWFAPKATERIGKLHEDAWRLEHQVHILKHAWTLEKSWLSRLPLQHPIAEPHHVSSGFGLRRDPFTRALSRHEGIDFVAPTGTPILATAPGRVRLARDWGPYGLTVDIEHEWGFTTRYAHLSRILVQEDEWVETGHTVGLLGNTGRSTGPHLHYEVRFHDRAINPQAEQVMRTARQHMVFPTIQLAKF